jgi:DNA-directed RNA polymerase subunit RPC12/RpoP
LWNDEKHRRELLMAKYDFEKEVIKDLKSCPYCGCKMDGSVYPPNLCKEEWKLSSTDLRIVCPRCGAAGPSGKTIEWAVIGWNRRGETD